MFQRAAHCSLRSWLLAVVVTACAERPAERTVVVYTALDRSFSEPIFERFRARSGVLVQAVYDTESTKSVGLANRLRAEADRPRCDVYWNNEILNTLRLADEGLLQPCDPSQADNLPPRWRDPDGRWFGFAARARVLIVNTELVPAADFPDSIEDLAAPRHRGRTAIAKPLFGTTASHVACLFAAWGAERATAWLDALAANDVQVQGGNKGCALAVAEGRADFGLTDTDDAIIELEAGRPVAIVYPDTGPGGHGTLFLPNTVSLVRGAPHPEAGEELIDFLLSPEVERALAEGPSAQIPLNRRTEVPPRVKGPADVRAMEVDLPAAAKAFEVARGVVEDRFLR